MWPEHIYSRLQIFGVGNFFSLLFSLFPFLFAKLPVEQSLWVKTISPQTISLKLMITNHELIVSWKLLLLRGPGWFNSSVHLSHFNRNILVKYLPLGLHLCVCWYQNFLFLIFSWSNSPAKYFFCTIGTILCFV